MFNIKIDIWMEIFSNLHNLKLDAISMALLRTSLRMEKRRKNSKKKLQLFKYSFVNEFR